MSVRTNFLKGAMSPKSTQNVERAPKISNFEIRGLGSKCLRCHLMGTPMQLWDPYTVKRQIPNDQNPSFWPLGFQHIQILDVRVLDQTGLKTELAQTVINIKRSRLVWFGNVHSYFGQSGRSVLRQCLNTEHAGNGPQPSCPNTKLVRISDVRCILLKIHVQWGT